MTRVIILIGFFALAFVAAPVRGGTIPVEFHLAGKEVRKACEAETGATDEMIDKASFGNFLNDDRLKCYLKCVFEKFKLVEGDNINFDAMMLLVPPSMKEAGMKMITNCRDITGTDLCDKSYNINKCFQKQAPHEYFIV